MTTSGGGSEGVPHEGYYPDPSIPGYVRYWNGSSWVPGTSRPQPSDGEALPPPASAAPAAARPPARSLPRPPAVEESGPMFLDEDPAAPHAQPGPPSGAPEWNADPARQAGVGEDARRVSWGSGGQGGQNPGDSVPRESGYGYPRTAPPATPGYGYPQAPIPSAPGGYGYPQPSSSGTGEGGVPWQRQVQDLARKDGPAAAGPGPHGTPEDPDHVMPWRPPVSNPFLQDIEQARPAGPGRRLAARVLDLVLVGAVVGGATFPLAMASVRHLQDKIDAARLSGENVQVWLIDGTTGQYLGALLGGLLLAGLLYEVLPTAKWGRTLGKKLFDLQVLDIESQLTPGFAQALRRMLVRQLLDFVVVGLVNVAWCAFDRPWRQCWHDKAARTFVAGPGER